MAHISVKNQIIVLISVEISMLSLALAQAHVQPSLFCPSIKIRYFQPPDVGPQQFLRTLICPICPR